MQEFDRNPLLEIAALGQIHRRHSTLAYRPDQGEPTDLAQHCGWQRDRCGKRSQSFLRRHRERVEGACLRAQQTLHALTQIGILAMLVEPRATRRIGQVAKLVVKLAQAGRLIGAHVLVLSPMGTNVGLGKFEVTVNGAAVEAKHVGDLLTPKAGEVMQFQDLGAARMLQRTIDRGERAQMEAALAKWHVADAATTSALDALALRGGAGFLEESGLVQTVNDTLGGGFHSGTEDVLPNIVAGWMGL